MLAENQADFADSIEKVCWAENAFGGSEVEEML